MTCELCGGRLYRKNRVGVCTANPECERENGRRKYVARLIANRHTEPAGEITYLIRARGTNLYKIGHSKNLEVRLQVLQSHDAIEVDVLATYPHGRSLENYLQLKLESEAIGGEWFRIPIPPGDVPAYISGLVEEFSNQLTLIAA